MKRTQKGWNSWQRSWWNGSTGRANPTLRPFRLPLNRFKAPRYFLCIRSRVECGNAEITFALGAESNAWGNHNLEIAQDFVECLPACVAFRSFYPDIRRICSTKY